MNSSRQKTLKFLITYLKPQKWRVLLLGIFIFLNLGLQVLTPQIMRQFIDSVIENAAISSLVRLSIIFLIAALGQQVINIITSFYTQNVGWTATNALREDLTRHTLNLDMSFHKTHPPGEMISRIDSDINTLNDFFSQFFLKLVGNLLLVVVILILLFLEDWRLGLVLTLFTMIALIVLTRFRNIAVSHWESQREAEAGFYSFLEERLAGTADIRANGGTAFTLRQFFERIKLTYQLSVKAGLMVNVMLNTMLLIFAIGTAASLIVSGTLFLGGGITIGTVYIVFQYNRMLHGPLEDISRQLSNVQKSMASIKRIGELLNTQTKIIAPESRPLRPNTLISTQLSVEFNDVSFHYEDDQPGNTTENEINSQDENVLENITSQLSSGEVLGLLGRTGSGKTTLIRLLFRLYDPQSGTIHLSMNQHLEDIRDLPLAKLRSRIGMVTQSIELFHATVRDNLTFFDNRIPDEDILRVIDELGLSRWFGNLPSGLDSVLESGGAGLSAGEAQLLAFTRVFLKDPGIIVLDEASSRLDPATENLIEKAVDRLVAGRTALVIAHRLKTVQRADKIMILEGGHILEFGDRKKLALDPSSHFYKLLQSGMDEVLV